MDLPVDSQSVGQSPARPDGVDKVGGSTVYVDDIVIDDMWHGATVRSEHAHARVLGIDTGAVSDPEAVFVTAADLPGANVLKLIAEDWPVLAANEVNHLFEPLALVAAPTRERALGARAKYAWPTKHCPPSSRSTTHSRTTRPSSQRARSTTATWNGDSRQPNWSSKARTRPATRSTSTSSPRA